MTHEPIQQDNPLLLEEKYSFLQTASKTNTFGTIIGPLLTAALLAPDADLVRLAIWLIAMTVSVLFRIYMVFIRNADSSIPIPKKISNLTLGVFLVTSSWGLGWLILVPTLSFNLQCLFLLMSSTAIFVGLYGYSIHRPTFLAFILPILICQFITSLIPPFIFSWPILLGEFAFSMYTLKMSSYFSDSWNKTVSLQIQNQILNKSLEQEYNSAIAANVAKSKFISTASHDLRQPLHAVNIYLDLFEPKLFTPSDQSNLMQIKKSIKSLNSMFNSLLDLSKLDSESSDTLLKSFEIEDLIKVLSSTYTPIALSKNLKLNFNYENLLVEGNSLILQQLLGNLITNAIQYTVEGEVAVNISSINNCLNIKVSDTGCGIDSKLLDHIFDEFFRVDATRNMHDGLGLGLSIVRRLCKITNSSISLQSEIGAGTTFEIQTRYQVSNALTESKDLNQASSTQSTSKQDELFASKCIAIFEDDLSILHAYEKALNKNGFSVLVLSEDHAELANQLAKIDRIDCILSDYRLKNTTGDVVIQQLRDSYGVDIPAIIITADTSPRHIQLFKNLNIHVFYKPISYGDIVKFIESILI